MKKAPKLLNFLINTVVKAVFATALTIVSYLFILIACIISFIWTFEIKSTFNTFKVLNNNFYEFLTTLIK